MKENCIADFEESSGYSYGIYLCHLPLMWIFYRKLAGTSPAIVRHMGFAVCIAAGFASQLLIVTWSDLQRDWQAGIAEWPEFLVVGVVGVVTLCLYYHLARVLNRRPSA